MIGWCSSYSLVKTQKSSVPVEDFVFSVEKLLTGTGLEAAWVMCAASLQYLVSPNTQ